MSRFLDRVKHFLGYEVELVENSQLKEELKPKRARKKAATKKKPAKKPVKKPVKKPAKKPRSKKKAEEKPVKELEEVKEITVIPETEDTDILTNDSKDNIIKG